MAKTHEECSLIVKDTLKQFFGEKDLDKKLLKFDELIQDIVTKAEREGVSPEIALSNATKDMTLKIRQKARQNYLNQEAYKRARTQVDEFKDKDLWRGIQSLIAIEGGHKYKAETASIYGRREALQNISMGLLVRNLDNAQIKKFASGQYDLEIKKILAGEVSEAEMGRMDPDLIAMANNARKMQDHLHQVKNQAGLDVGYQKNRVGKQFHSGPGMIRYGETKWKALARDRMDFEKMGLKTEEDIVKRLDDIWTKRTSSKGQGFVQGVSDDLNEITIQSSTKNMGANRSVHFKDAESAHIYDQEVNGGQSLLTSLMIEVERDSGKISAVESLGPNFSANWTKIMSEVEMTDYRRASLDSQFNNTVYGSKGKGSGFWSNVANVPKKIANMTMLGAKTLLSTGTDMAFGPHILSADTGKNMLESVGASLNSVLKTFPNQKQAAIQGSVFLQDVLDSTFNTNFHENGLVTNWFDKTHDFYMKATGLPMQSRWFKTANANAFNHIMFNNRGTAFDALDTGTKNLFDRYGIGADEWSIISKSEGAELPDGRGVIDSLEILDMDLDNFSGSATQKKFKRNELATNYNAMLVEFAESSSPTPNSQTMHWVEQSNPNTPLGAAARLAGQFKSFSFSMEKTLMRIKGADAINMKSGTRLASAVITATTLRYGVDYLRAIYDGKEPPDATDPKTWAETALKSGVGGIYADFLSVDYSTNIWRDPVKDMAGPGPRVMTDAIKGTIEAGKYVYSALDGDPREADKQMGKILKRLEKNTALPFIQNKLNKEIYDHIHLLMNTGARR